LPQSVKDEIKSGDVFYDIGANQGLFSVFINKALRNKVEIHIFEPISDNFNVIEKNLGLGNIFLNNVAIFDHEGKIKFKLPKKSMLSQSTIIEEVAEKYLKDYYEIKIKCMTLDDYVNNHKPPTFIKIDVEGAEPFVIEGDKKLFFKFNPQIIMEILTGNIGLKYSLKAATKLEELGYIYKISDETGRIEIQSLGKIENFIKGRIDINGDNFLFKK